MCYLAINPEQVRNEHCENHFIMRGFHMKGQIIESCDCVSKMTSETNGWKFDPPTEKVHNLWIYAPHHFDLVGTSSSILAAWKCSHF